VSTGVLSLIPITAGSIEAKRMLWFSFSRCTPKSPSETHLA
jgi:hypothetical protein